MTEPLRVVVVEGFRDAHKMYVEGLVLKRYHVTAAADGLGAVQMTEALIPDVIVLDIGLAQTEMAARDTDVTYRGGGQQFSPLSQSSGCNGPTHVV